jgi:hypothetical protein
MKSGSKISRSLILPDGQINDRSVQPSYEKISLPGLVKSAISLCAKNLIC